MYNLNDKIIYDNLDEETKSLYASFCSFKKKDINDMNYKDVIIYPPKKIIRRKTFSGGMEAEHHASQNYDVSIIPVLRLVIVDFVFAKKYEKVSKIICKDDCGHKVFLNYFNSKQFYAVTRKLKKEQTIIVSNGRFSNWYGNIQISTPDIYIREFIETDIIEPIYEDNKKISSFEIKKLIKNLIADIDFDFDEWIPEQVIKDKSFPCLQDALKTIHCIKRINPDNIQDWYLANERLLFDELLSHQIILQKARYESRNQIKQYNKWSNSAENCISFIEKQGYILTDEQKQAIIDIATDLRDKPYPMNRLLQGDVGTGKTLCAFATMLCNNNAVSVYLCPTEILAYQVYNKFCEITGFVERSRLLTSSHPKNKNERNDLIKDIHNGKHRYIFGTHSILQDYITQINNLTLAIIDEQHKFGVEQRMKLESKNPNHKIDILSMSATPIPRTMLMTQYGNLSVSTLRDRPNKKDTPNYRTTIYKKNSENLHTLLKKIRESVNDGEQVYWVVAIADEEAKSSLMDIKQRKELFDLSGLFNNKEVAILYGKMKSKEKTEIMKKFQQGDIKVLISTTVIEVGIDIHNANIMIIESPETLGLSQLHQLRGRVGRGDKQGVFVLLYDENASEITKRRLKIMKENTDGFIIAEKDLQMRGGGNILTAEQSGRVEFMFGNFMQDSKLLELAFNESIKLNYEKLNISKQILINLFADKYVGEYYKF